MASKRKKSRPTRITKEDVPAVGDGLDGSSYYEEDTLTEIQRYIEEGSEDTPDCLERKLVQSGESEVECVPPDTECGPSSRLDISEDGERSFTQIFVNGHIPSNLKFHQLMKDELESLKGVAEDLAMPAIPNKKLSRKRSKPIEDETPRYSCTMCKYVTNRSDHYKRHLMTHSADKPLKCTLCSYGTGRSDHYKRHLQRHGLSEHEIIATCFRNGLKLKNASPVGQSLENDGHTNTSKENHDKASTTHGVEPGIVIRVEKRYKCNQCSYSTDKSSHLTRHQNSHSKSSLSRCDKCNRSFRTQRSLKDHNCFETQGHKCPKCAKIFADRKTMMCHIVDKHHFKVDGLKPVPVTSPFSQNILLNRHTIAGHEAKMSAFSTNVVFSGTKNSSVFRNKSETTPSLHVSTSAGVEEHKPMDLTLANKREIGDAVSKKHIGRMIHSGLPKIPNDMPSDRGNMGCTKCGEWFNKLNEYSTHACVS